MSTPRFARYESMVLFNEWLETLRLSGFPSSPKSNDLSHFPASCESKALLPGVPSSKGAGISAWPWAKSMHNSSRTCFQSAPQFWWVTPTAGATNGKNWCLCCKARIVLWRLVTTSTNWITPRSSSKIMLAPCWASLQRAREYTTKRTVPQNILSQMSELLSNTLCNFSSSLTWSGLAWLRCEGTSTVAAPQHLLPRSKASHSKMPMVYLTNAMASRMPLARDAGAPWRRSSHKTPYKDASVHGKESPTRSSCSHKIFMLFALFVKVPGALPLKTSPNIISCALTESQPEMHCTNSTASDQDEIKTSQCLIAFCNWASLCSCHVTSSVLLTQHLKRGWDPDAKPWRHCFLCVSTSGSETSVMKLLGIGRLKFCSKLNPKLSLPNMHFQKPEFQTGSTTVVGKEFQAAPMAWLKFTWLNGSASTLLGSPATWPPLLLLSDLTEGAPPSSLPTSKRSSEFAREGSETPSLWASAIKFPLACLQPYPENKEENPPTTPLSHSVTDIT